MRVRFTSIPERLPYPPSHKAKLSTYHSEMISSLEGNFTGKYADRCKIIAAMNAVSYLVLSGDAFDPTSLTSPMFSAVPQVDDDECISVLKDMYIVEKDVVWDIEKSTTAVDAAADKRVVKPDPVRPATGRPSKISQKPATTSKSDLYIQPPIVPRFNPKDIWAGDTIGDTLYAIHTTLPVVPATQNQISVTTDVNQFTSSDLRRLYPSQVVNTRPAVMYEHVKGLELHPVLGNILPIQGYTRDQLIDNLVKYPHLFRLQKEVDSQVVSFYPTIEIDGELYKIADIWDHLEDTASIPYNTDFIKEYVVRRYLLERDIKGVNHRYKMYGELDPFLTLFAPIDTYLSLGYIDVEGIARKCVMSRVAFKRSRNPVLRRLADA